MANTAINIFGNSGEAMVGVDTLNDIIAGKQATLVSGTNIKTVNGNTLLGSGDVELTASDVGALPDNTVIPTGIEAADPADGTWTINLSNGNTITMDLNHTHPQYQPLLTAGTNISIAEDNQTGDLVISATGGGDSGNVGNLNTNNTSALTVSSSESFSGNISLHKISKTGSYKDLNNQPTIPSASTITPLMDGTAAIGLSSNKYAKADHVHPSDTSRVPTSRKINNKPLTGDITLNASDVGAMEKVILHFEYDEQNDEVSFTDFGGYELTHAEVRSICNSGAYIFLFDDSAGLMLIPRELSYDSWAFTYGGGLYNLSVYLSWNSLNSCITCSSYEEDYGVPSSRTINNKALTNDITLTASDVGAIPMAISTTYANLVTTRTNSQLTAGAWYRITDYTCTTTQTNTQSAGHQFDILVQATSPNTLSEEAKAIRHEGDTYFANSDLEAWKIWYCLDNDTTRFAWADATNGKGVIYRMIDEWNNDCPYDFKNIQFKRDLTDGVLDTENGTTTWVYTFNLWDTTQELYFDASIIGNTLKSNEGFVNGVHNNKMGVVNSFNMYYGDGYDKTNFVLPNNVFLTKGEDGNYYGCYSNTLGNICYSNTFGDNCNYNTFGDRCASNIFGEGCGSNTFGEGCRENTFGNYSDNNMFGNNCGYNTLGESCYANMFGNYCGSNTFGEGCYANTFGDNCNAITFSKSYTQYVIVENGNRRITLTSTQTPTSNTSLRNITIAQGVNNTSTTKTISHNTLNDTFRTTYTTDVNGNIYAIAPAKYAEWDKSYIPLYIQISGTTATFKDTSNNSVANSTVYSWLNDSDAHVVLYDNDSTRIYYNCWCESGTDEYDFYSLSPNGIYHIYLLYSNGNFSATLTDNWLVSANRKINNKSLGSDITLTASDVGAITRFVVDFTLSGTTISNPNKTFLEIKAAYDAGNLVLARDDIGSLYYLLYCEDTDCGFFCSDSGTLYTINVDSSDTWTYQETNISQLELELSDKSQIIYMQKINNDWKKLTYNSSTGIWSVNNTTLTGNTKNIYLDKDNNDLYYWDGSEFVLIDEDNVQADWNQSDSTKADYIKNKPVIPNSIKVGSVAGKLYRNDVNGGGNFTVKGNSGCIPNLTAGTFLVSIYANSTTQSYTFKFNFGSVSYNLSTTNGEINDVREITIPSNGTFSGSVLNGSVAPGTILYVVMYNYLTPVSTVGVAAVTNRYSDLDGTPTIPTVNNGTLTIKNHGVTVGTFTANQSGNTTADITTEVVTVSGTGSITQALDANKFYKFGSVSALTLTLNAAGSGLAIYAGKFTASADNISITLPSGTSITDSSVDIESGNTYEFSILDGVCIISDITTT